MVRIGSCEALGENPKRISFRLANPDGGFREHSRVLHCVYFHLISKILSSKAGGIRWAIERERESAGCRQLSEARPNSNGD